VKRQAALVLVVAAAVAMVPIALGSHTASKCGGKTSVLVWPKGHGVIKHGCKPYAHNQCSKGTPLAGCQDLE